MNKPTSSQRRRSDLREERVIKKVDWLEIIQKDKYIYVRETPTDQKVVVLPFNKNDEGQMIFMGRMENCPSHNDIIELGCVGGGLEPDETPEHGACRELEEEGGVTCEVGELIPLGAVRPSRAASATVHLFAVEVERKEIDNTDGDGSEVELTGYPKWVSFSEASQSKDPLFPAMICRLINYMKSI